MKELSLLFFKILDLILFSSKRDVWLFPQGRKESWESNQRDLFEYLLENGDVKPVAVLNPGQSHDYPSGNVIRSDNFFTICRTLLSASVVFLHHGSGDLKVKFFKTKKRTYIHLGHGGLMYKKQGLNELKNRSKKRLRKLKKKASQYDFYFVNSQMDKIAAIASYGFPYGNVRVTGQARSDRLLSLDAKEYGGVEFSVALDKILSGRKLITYAPTWRDDGGGIYEFSDDEISRLSELLEKAGCVLGIDGHQYIKKRRIPKGDSFIDLKSIVGADTPSIMQKSELLITDYSSIWVDFILLNRPVVGFFYDWDEYRSSRGFQLDCEAMFPGRVCYDFDGLLSVLDSYFNEGAGLDERYSTIKGLVHHYTEVGFCERAYVETVRCIEQRND